MRNILKKMDWVKYGKVNSLEIIVDVTITLALAVLIYVVVMSMYF